MSIVHKASKKQERLSELLKYYKNYLDTTVKGGFPVTVWYKIEGAEPDVGIMSDYVDDWELTTLDGRSCEWLKLSEKDEQTLLDEVHKAMDNGGADDCDDDY